MSRDKDTPLAGKVAIVTGAGRGLGRAEALELARAGASVVVNDLGVAVSSDVIEGSPAGEVVAEIRALGGQAVANGDDIATMAGAKAVVEAALDSFGRLDILVNNAGIIRPSNILDMSERDWDDVIRVHLKGHFAMVRHAAPVMRDRGGGVIVNTGSTSGLGHYANANYAAAKEGVIGFTATIARDLGEHNIRCNAVRPLGLTRMGIDAVMESVRYSQEVLGVAANGSFWVRPLAESPDPGEVGVFVAWLCTDAARGVTGRNFFVGGGRVGLFPEPELCRSLVADGGWTMDRLNRIAADQLIGDLANPYAHLLAREPEAVG